jgi:glycosyltransferase involved in cell wall biosynthesis
VKKKILFVRTTLGQGGADRVTSILLQYIDRSKYEVSLLLMKREGEHLVDVPKDVVVFDTKAKSLWVFLPALLKNIRKVSPDVVFSIDGGVNVPLSIIAFFSPQRKWKCILSERNILFPPGKNKLKRSLMLLAKKIFYRFADELTAVSEGVRADMQNRLSISSHRIKIVYNPVVEKSMLLQATEMVNHPWFSETRQLPVVVHAGRFVYQKDHAMLVNAFAILNKKVSCRLFLLGDGPLQPSIRKMVTEKGLDDVVQFAGFDLNPFKFFSKCDLFVLSSLHEGMPGVLIQAMACGAASISTNCPSGPDEIIDRPGVNGILVPISDSNAMANAMYKVITDNVLAESLKKNAVLAVKKFKIEEALQTYLSVIES